MKIKLLETSEWKTRSSKDMGLIKSIEAETEDAGDRQLRFTISNGGVDRYNDRVIQSGWKLENYNTNPVVLFNHDEALIIGRCVEIGLVGDKLKATVEFLAGDTPHFGELADGVYRMLKGKYLNAVSVGFRVLDYDKVDDDARPRGCDYTSQDLLEFSIVTIPALPSALIEPGQRGAPIEQTKSFVWNDPEKRQRALDLVSKLNK